MSAYATIRISAAGDLIEKTRLGCVPAPSEGLAKHRAQAGKPEVRGLVAPVAFRVTPKN